MVACLQQGIIENANWSLAYTGFDTWSGMG
jgi:hypothetical protein